jgi:cyclopentanol dehydrogenase
MNRLNNKVAIITGAAGGMGAAEAKLFAQEGAKVMATDIQEDKLQAWVADAKKEGLAIECMKHDVTSESDWAAVAAKTMGLFGRINILVNNAGIYPAGLTLDTTTKDKWDNVIAINLTGPFLGCRTVVPYMRQAGGGSIVNIASIAGFVGGNGTAYSASKGGLHMITKDLAVVLAPDNIRVNGISPGGVLTPMTQVMVQTEAMKAVIKAMSPQGRMADAMEIAYGALYLASDEASFATGTELVLDGGMIAR